MPQVLTRLLILMLAEAERVQDDPWVKLSAWRQTAKNWLQRVKGRSKLREAQMLACFGLSRDSPVICGSLSPFRHLPVFLRDL